MSVGAQPRVAERQTPMLCLIEVNARVCLSSRGPCRWCPAEEHGRHESHAESGENPRDPGHNEGPFKGDDEGERHSAKLTYEQAVVKIRIEQL